MEDVGVWTVYNMVSLSMVSLLRFAMGMMETLLGPCIPDFAHKFNMTIDSYTSTFAARGYALVLGLPITAFVLDHAYHYIELAFSVAMFGFGICTVMIPWFGSKVMLSTIFGVQGFFFGNINLCGAVHCVRLFGSSAAPFVSVIGIIFSLGKIVAPLMAEPFITNLNPEPLQVLGDIPVAQKNNSMYNSTMLSYISTENYLPFNLSSISHIIWSKSVHVPFIAFGVLCGIVTIGFVILFFLKPSNAVASKKHELYTETNLPPVAKYTVIVLFTGIMIFFITLQRGFAYYLYFLATQTGLHFPKQEATYLFSVVEMTSLCSRIVFMCVLNKIPVAKVFHFSISVTLVFFVCLAIFGLRSHLTFWIFAPLTNAFLDPLFILILSYADRYIFVSGWISAVIETGVAVGLMLAGLVLSHILKVYSTQGLLVAFCVLAVIVNILSISVYLIGSHYGDRYDSKCSKEKLLDDEKGDLK